MTACNDCRREISNGSWFCDFCGSERPDCLQCGTGLRFHECPSCSAAPEAPCENCGTRVTGDVRECPHCGYDAGGAYEEKANSWSHSKLAVIGGGTLLLLAVTQMLVSIGSGFFPPGIFQTGFRLMTWFFGLLGVGAWLLIGGSFSVISDSWGSHRASQAERATAADIERAEKAHQSEEYREQLRRERERKRREQEKRKEQRSKDFVQCPDCGKLVYMTVEGEVTNVKTDSQSGALSGLGNAIDTIGADNTKDCPRCGSTVMIESEVV